MKADGIKATQEADVRCSWYSDGTLLDLILQVALFAFLFNDSRMPHRLKLTVDTVSVFRFTVKSLFEK